MKLNNLRKISYPHGDLEQRGLSDFLGQEKQHQKRRAMEKQRKKKEALARWHGIKQCDGDFTALDPDVDCDFKT